MPCRSPRRNRRGRSDARRRCWTRRSKSRSGTSRRCGWRGSSRSCPSLSAARTRCRWPCWRRSTGRRSPSRACREGNCGSRHDLPSSNKLQVPPLFAGRCHLTTRGAVRISAARCRVDGHRPRLPLRRVGVELSVRKADGEAPRGMASPGNRMSLIKGSGISFRKQARLRKGRCVSTSYHGSSVCDCPSIERRALAGPGISARYTR